VAPRDGPIFTVDHFGGPSVQNKKPIHPVFAIAASGLCRLMLSGFLLAAMFVGLMPHSAEAQVLYGSLIGNVTDPTGNAIAGASVDAADTATNTIRTTTTNGSGAFQFTDLTPGTYTLSITANTFAKVVSEGIVIESNTQERFDSRLQPATIGQTVMVTTAPPELQTDRASVTSELGASQLEQLPGGPNAGMRNFQSLYTIVPGFSPPAAAHSEAGNPGDTLVTNVNGVSESNNNTRIDGVSDIYPWLPEIAAYSPSTEAIASVNIVTNSFDAEQGIAAGTVVNVTTKSGTNRFHGTAWEYNTISALQAKNYYLPATTPHVPKFILNQFGANYGGPIWRNKAFFFANWERSRRSEAENGFETIATPAMRAGDFQGTGTTIYNPFTGNANGTGRQPFPNDTIPASMISFAALQMISILPEPNINTSSLSNNYFDSASSEYTRDNIDSRVDIVPSSKSTIFGRYGIQRATLFDPQPLGKAGGNPLDGGQPGTAPSQIQSIGLGGTYALRPNLLLDANFGFLRQALSAENTDLDTNYGLTFLDIPGTNGTNRLQGGFPNFQMTNMADLGNSNVSNPFTFRDNTYTTAANLSWNLGKHSTRYGLEYQHYAINHFQPEATYGPRGGFTFTGGVSALSGGATPNGYNTWADFLLGLPEELGKDIQFLDPAALRESVWAFYARDQWQISEKLTLNYGLRYEYYPIATRDHTGPDIFNPTDGNVYIGGMAGVPENAGVNVGNGNLGPRIGLAYRIDDKTVIRSGYGMSVNPDNFRNITTAYPSVISQQIFGANSYQPAGSLVTGIPAATFPDVSLGVLKLSPTLTTTTLPQNYRRGYYQSYNLAVERELPAGISLQTTYVGTLITREVVQLDINASAPGTGKTGGPLYPTLGITASENSLMPMGTGSYNGLQVVAKRRFADGGTFGVNYTYSRAIDDYGDNSEGEQTILVPYLPDYYRNRGLAGFDRKHNLQAYTNYLLPFGRGHAFSPGGFAGYLISGWTLSGILSRTSGTPFTVEASGTSLNAPGNTQFANQVVPKVQILGGHDSAHPYFEPTDFAPVKTAVFGTTGINSVRGPGYFNLSTSLARTFAFTERFNLLIRGEAFNLTNTPEFANPGSNVSSESSTGLNGYSVITTASNQRQLRFSARFNF
jgi:hypothetical protein